MHTGEQSYSAEGDLRNLLVNDKPEVKNLLYPSVNIRQDKAAHSQWCYDDLHGVK